MVERPFQRRRLSLIVSRLSLRPIIHNTSQISNIPNFEWRDFRFAVSRIQNRAHITNRNRVKGGIEGTQKENKNKVPASHGCISQFAISAAGLSPAISITTDQSRERLPSF